MANATKKKIIKALANAPATAIKKAMQTMTDDERAETMRVCQAVGIKLNTNGGK